MNVCDFSRSFVTFRVDLQERPLITVSQPPPFTLNNSRFLLECRCRIARPNAAAATEFVLSASCKAEQVWVKENIWHDPSADMCLVASDEDFMVAKSWDRNNRGVMLNPPSLGPQPERQVGKIRDAFSRLKIDIHEAPGRVLTNVSQIVAAVLENRCLVSQTEYEMPDGTKVWIEYPVKLINASERETFYQVDTGPVLVPDLTAYDGKSLISMLRLAFMAHNDLGCTEMLLNVPTPIADGISVNHYSRVLKVQAVNRLIEVA